MIHIDSMQDKRFFCLLWLMILVILPLAAQPELEIWEIQSNTNASPYINQLVTSKRNIVTYVTSDRFFIQCPPERIDNDDLSSDGIMVYTDTPSGLNVGDLVTVTGFIQEYFNLTEFGPDQLIIQLDSTGVTLPASYPLDAQFPTDIAQPIHDLERLEGMRVSLTNGHTVSPIFGEGIVSTIARPLTERPFREAGIAYPGQSNLPVWDNNPELFQINLRWINQTDIHALQPIEAEGVLTFAGGSYQLLASSYTVDNQPSTQPVRAPLPTEATVASLNCYLYFEDESDYPARRFKLARYVIEQLQAPDIVAVQEVGSLSALNELAAEITDQRPDLQYDAYLEVGNGDFPINLGFLVRPTVTNISIQQWGADELLSTGGLLHDRPPILLEGQFNTEPPTPVSVLNVHLRSLNGIEGNSANFVRTKRYEQSVSVANMVRDLTGSNLIVVGDFNAFEFSDGYVDVLNQIMGTPSLGAQFPVQDIVEEPLVNRSAEISDPLQRYSYVFRGNAQILDHCLTSSTFTGMSFSELQYARGNADAPSSLTSNSFVPFRVSDHDGFVAYLSLNDTLTVSTQMPSIEPEFRVDFPNPFPQHGWITVRSDQSISNGLILYNSLGQIVWQRPTEQSPGIDYQVQVDAHLPSGLYWLKIVGSSKNYPLVVP